MARRARAKSRAKAKARTGKDDEVGEAGERGLSTRVDSHAETRSVLLV